MRPCAAGAKPAGSGASSIHARTVALNSSGASTFQPWPAPGTMWACTVLRPRQPACVQTPIPFTVLVVRGPQPACRLTVSRVEVTDRGDMRRWLT